MAAVKHPAETPFFYDQTWTDTWPIETDPPSSNLYGLGGTTSLPAVGFHRLTKARHGSGGGGKAPKVYGPGSTATAAKMPGAINMGFGDGHAETVKLPRLWSFFWHAKWNPASVTPPIESLAATAGN